MVGVDDDDVGGLGAVAEQRLDGGPALGAVADDDRVVTHPGPPARDAERLPGALGEQLDGGADEDDEEQQPQRRDHQGRDQPGLRGDGDDVAVPGGRERHRRVVEGVVERDRAVAVVVDVARAAQPDDHRGEEQRAQRDGEAQQQRHDRGRRRRGHADQPDQRRVGQRTAAPRCVHLPGLHARTLTSQAPPRPGRGRATACQESHVQDISGPGRGVADATGHAAGMPARPDATARSQPPGSPTPAVPAGRADGLRLSVALAALLTTMGVLHLVAPAPFDAIVPRSLPGGPRFWTLASGLAELGVAAAVAVPRTRQARGGGRRRALRRGVPRQRQDGPRLVGPLGGGPGRRLRPAAAAGAAGRVGARGPPSKLGRRSPLGVIGTAVRLGFRCRLRQTQTVPAATAEAEMVGADPGGLAAPDAQVSAPRRKLFGRRAAGRRRGDGRAGHRRGDRHGAA